MRAPRHWSRPPDSPGWQARTLAPLGWLYARETARRTGGARPRAPVPVICIGNLSAGGTGKTPAAIALAQHLSDTGHRVQFLSRGHGGRLAGPAQVDPARHTSADVGDEPLLLSAFGPAWVARDRLEGARAAARAGAEVVLMDDGFQSATLAPDLSILIVDAATGFGNGRVIPAGPLREPVAAGLARADAVLSVGAPEAQAGFDAAWPAAGALPRLRGRIAPLQTGMDWSDLRVVAFAGIGRPEKFFATLRDMGARIAAAHALGDHEPIAPALFQRLLQEARQAHAQLVTTEKDAVRLSPQERREVLVLPVRMTVADWAPLAPLLTGMLADRRG
ncbi:tetraacyldisaccharide 4'-kinase [Mesobaculum littorinae]|uniref:Tetraacyldisaccharide 4'-kinase n=1 Tax=Mesobaculum littorinae TaxID=2486419 RepID=A0A438AHB7_9RHOB|nr:tetraacyldisaccharide 4'-kinase [Mesobaculum littorinae]RVV98068.1 tetraacyldisaccharide 4'-kinase [Mesobaculum littorinae]